MNNKQIIIISVIVIIILIFLLFLISWYDFIQQNMRSGGKEINDYFKSYSSYYDNSPIFNPEDFPWTKNFIKNLPSIQEEFYNYQKRHLIPEYKSISKEASGETKGWHSLFLRIFGNDTQNMKAFPKTKQLIDSCPCTTAYFSLLKPGTKIKPHKGIFSGVIRYHLSIKIPKDWEKCFIVVDGKKLHWREGGHIMFDDSYIHMVENNTDEERVVLFLDIKRDFKSLWLNAVNEIMLKYIKSNDMVNSSLTKINKMAKN
jgi:beta-hydroxylase